MRSIGLICGLQREADALPGYRTDRPPMVRCAAAHPDRARSLARLLVQAGCSGLLSFGVGGGLSADVRPGTVVVADAVVLPNGRRIETSEVWRNGLLQAITGKFDIRIGAIAGCESVVGNRRAKRDLRERTGALLADTESHAIAEVASHAKLPFMAVRTVLDPAGRGVPGWLNDLVDNDGEIDSGALTAGIVTHPWDLPRLVLLGVESARAMRSLRGVAAAAGSRFGLDR